MSDVMKLPDVRRVSLTAPLAWLASGWRDYRSMFIPATVYGLVLFALSVALVAALYVTGSASWFFVLVGGFLLIAPMLAMGAYQGARLLELGQRPTVNDLLVVGPAIRRDVLILGVALFILYGFWVEVAYLIYGLSTYRLHSTLTEFIQFLLFSAEGLRMALIGTLAGGAIAFVAFTFVVVSAPMLLERQNDIFMAVATSVRSVFANFHVMLLWAFLIAGLTLISVAAGLVPLIVVFPWIGLSSWHAYRHLVDQSLETHTAVSA